MLLGIVCLTIAGCRRDEAFYFDALVDIEGGGYQDRQLSQEKIDELKAAIRRYSRDVKQQVEATEQSGVYYKMLAVEYMNANMFAKALESLDEARNINPENPILFYLSGLCAARSAKAEVLEQTDRFDMAEQYYLRAIRLDPGYVDALYALSVLYSFELDRAADAIPLLETVINTQRKNSEARFLMARVYAQLGRLDDAIQMYEQVIEVTTSREKKEQALANKKELLEHIYGTQ